MGRYYINKARRYTMCGHIFKIQPHLQNLLHTKILKYPPHTKFTKSTTYKVYNILHIQSLQNLFIDKSSRIQNLQNPKTRRAQLAT